MGADVMPRHKSLVFMIKAVLFWWQLVAIDGYSPDLLSVPERIPIGALFPHNDKQDLQTIFKHCISEHNLNQSSKFIVETAVEFVDERDPTPVVRQQQCLHFNRGIYAFFTPKLGALAYKSALSFSNTYRVPLVGSSPPVPHHQRDHSTDHLPAPEYYGINLEPNYWPAIISVLKWYQWTKLIYIYDSDYGFFELQELLKHSHRSEHRIELTVIKRITNAGEGYKLLKSLGREAKDAMKYVILNCNLHVSKALIAYHIQDTAMDRSTYHYLLTNKVLSDWWSKEVPSAYNAVNITSFSMPADKNELKKLIHMKRPSMSDREAEEEKAPAMEEILAFDATRVLLQAFNLIIQSQINITKALETESIASTVNFTRKTIDPTCPTLKPFKFGEMIANHLKITSTKGITNNIEFHSSGYRKNYTIEVLEINDNGLFKKIALWSDLSGLKILHPNRHRVNDGLVPSKPNMTYTITTILVEPFLMLKKPEKGRTLAGNERFEGFIKDFTDLLSKSLNFKYELRLVNDSKFGSFDPNIGWNGMIRQLMSHEVNMAIAPLTITSARSRVVDFTHPFMATGISMMMKKPSVMTPDYYPFLRPLTKEVWASIVLALLSVSLIFYIVSKLSFDRQIGDNNQSTDISLDSSLTYSVGILVYQVSGIYPHSLSSRIVSFVWWLFVFVVVTSYLSNLTANSVLTKTKFTLYHISGKYETLSDAFLYFDQMPVPITSADDLVKQSVIDYGTLRHSSTQQFFSSSKTDVFSRLWERMNTMDSVFVDSLKEGVEKVRESNGRYVLFMETTMNDYINEQKPCNTFRVSKNLNSIEYGIALPLSSPLRDELNSVILTLKENGDFARLENKWWAYRSQCRLIDIKELSNSNITFNNIFIALIILSIGLIFAFIVSIVEHFCNRKVSYKTRQSSYTIAKQEEREESIEEEDKSSAKRRIIKD